MCIRNTPVGQQSRMDTDGRITYRVCDAGGRRRSQSLCLITLLLRCVRKYFGIPGIMLTIQSVFLQEKTITIKSSVPARPGCCCPSAPPLRLTAGHSGAGGNRASSVALRVWTSFLLSLLKLFYRGPRMRRMMSRSLSLSSSVAYTRPLSRAVSPLPCRFSSLLTYSLISSDRSCPRHSGMDSTDKGPDEKQVVRYNFDLEEERSDETRTLIFPEFVMVLYRLIRRFRNSYDCGRLRRYFYDKQKGLIVLSVTIVDRMDKAS